MNRVKKWLPPLAKVGVALTFCVMALGAFTRLMDAGLGCPDWPGCYGHWVVSHLFKAHSVDPSTSLVAYKVWAEMIHRYVAGILAFLVTLVLLLLVYSTVKTKEKRAGFLALGLFLLIVYQILLGRWTVTWHLLPIVVTQHLLGAMSILSLLWLTTLSFSRSHSSAQGTRKIEGTSFTEYPKWVKILPLVGLCLLIIQIVLGAWTSTHYASLSCSDFPLCRNEGPWFPMAFQEAFHISTLTQLNYEGGLLSERARETIHMCHRLGAGVITSYLLFMVCVLFPYLKKNYCLMITAFCTVGVLLMQVTLGIANVLFQLPLFIAVGHNVMASVLLLCLVTLSYHVNKKE